MKEPTVQVRIYESDYQYVKKEAEEGDTTIARIIHEALVDEKSLTEKK